MLAQTAGAEIRIRRKRYKRASKSFKARSLGAKSDVHTSEEFRFHETTVFSTGGKRLAS
jgi:hypothetical protein